MSNIKFNIYPSLLDTFVGYQRAEITWEKYWGFSENPKFSCEEYVQGYFDGLINMINRVESDEVNRACAQGTAFNNLIDKLAVDGYQEGASYLMEQDGFAFSFTINGCVKDAIELYKEAMSQVRVGAVLPTRYGDVYLYGYVDELLPLSIEDIKTTENYYVGKFRHHTQHLVYPYCVYKMSGACLPFVYRVFAIKDGNIDCYKERYDFNEQTIPNLTKVVEDLCEFLLQNKELITDPKIFNQQ